MARRPPGRPYGLGPAGALVRPRTSLVAAAAALLLMLLLSPLLAVVEGQQNGEVDVPTRPRAVAPGAVPAAGPAEGQREGARPFAEDQRKVALQYIDANGQPVLVQFTYVGPPKILPIATADSYPEGSTINLICTVSGGQRKGLALSWDKDGRELADGGGGGDSSAGGYPLLAAEPGNLSVEKTGADISILRITNATHANSGRFTCRARNPLGEDSTSVGIVINVELKWNKIPVDSEIGLNKDLTIECDATSEPKPQIQWTRLASSTSAKSPADAGKPVALAPGRTLKIARAQHKDSGLYECVARNGVDQELRRVIRVLVRGE